MLLIPDMPSPRTAHPTGVHPAMYQLLRPQNVIRTNSATGKRRRSLSNTSWVGYDGTNYARDRYATSPEIHNERARLQPLKGWYPEREKVVRNFVRPTPATTPATAKGASVKSGGGSYKAQPTRPTVSFGGKPLKELEYD